MNEQKMIAVEENDPARLAVMAAYDILDTEPEDAFDRIVRIAAREMGTPIALITLLDGARQWAKARIGLEVEQTPIEQAFCRFTIRQHDMLVVNDAQLDIRFANNPLVTGSPHIRFYAGAPLVTPEGYALGALCVIDSEPRQSPSQEQRETLLDLATLVMNKLELRRQLRLNTSLLGKSRIVEQLIALAAEAESFGAALRSATTLLQLATGAQATFVLRLAQDGTRLLFVDGVDSSFSDPDTLRAKMCHVVLSAETSLAARAMQSGQQLTSQTGCPNIAHSDINRIAISAGIKSQLFTPFSLFDQHYVFVLGFGEGKGTPEDAAALMRSAVNALRPLLRRLLDEERLALFQRALEASSDPVLISSSAPTDEAGPAIVYANPAVECVTGYQVDELVGKSLEIFNGPETEAKAIANIRDAMQSWKPVRQTLLNYRKDGKPFWNEVYLSPLANRDGNWTHWITVQRDLSTERALVADSDAVRRDLLALIDAIPGVLMRHQPTHNGKWCRTYIADSVYDLTGYTVEEALITGWWVNNVDQADAGMLYERLERALHGEDVTITFRFKHKDAHWIWVRVIMNGHSDRFGKPEVISIWSDVTYERELADHLAQTSKLAQLGEMATGMAHELNQPLAAISLAAQNTERELNKLGQELPRVTRRLQTIVEMAGRASELIDHMRVFGRVGTEPSGPVDLHAVVAQATKLLFSKLRQDNVRVHIDLPQSLPPVLAKSVPLEQVLINLFANSCDAYAMRDSLDEDEPRKIFIQAWVADDKMVITIRDQAGGIPGSIMDNIFVPFFSTKPNGVGTGLGLSISYGIIVEFGGTIEACNEDSGAKFTIRLPLAAMA